MSERERKAEWRRYNSHDDLPVVGLESLSDILSEGNVGGSVNGDLVVVVDGDKVSELEVTE